MRREGITSFAVVFETYFIQLTDDQMCLVNFAIVSIALERVFASTFESATTIPSAVYGCADDETNVHFLQLLERDLRIAA